jgi:GNAT superfamily N-acetyltransferase
MEIASASMTPPQRLARREDIAALQSLMRKSVEEIFPTFYDQRQTKSAAIHIAHLDELLVDDGTYFVHEADGEIVACGGWSRRNRLYAGEGEAEDDDRLLDPATESARVRAMFVRSDWTRQGIGGAILDASEAAAAAEGFTRMVLGATLPGVPLYAAYGFVERGRFTLVTPDGVELAGVSMEKDIAAI